MNSKDLKYPDDYLEWQVEEREKDGVIVGVYDDEVNTHENKE